MTAQLAQNKRRSKTEKRKSILWLTEAQAALSWIAILVLAALVGAIYLFQASRIASVGREVQELQWELDEVKRVNSELERDIAESQSLDRLQKEILRLGFVRAQPEDIDYIVVTDFPADKEVESIPMVTEKSDPVETIGQALWLAVESSFTDLVRGESQ